MEIKKLKLLKNSDASLTAYLLDDGELERENVKRKGMLICPGGGYTYVSKNEGEPVAMFFARQGYQTFVLNYSTKIENPFPKALVELANAMAVIKNNLDEWHLLDDISVIGFSAGGHLALSLGCFYNDSFLTSEIGLKKEDLRPSKILLGYPAVTLHPKREGPLPPEILEQIEKGLMPDFRGPNIREILIGHENPTKEEQEKLNLIQYLHKDMPPVFAFGSYEDTVIPASDILKLGEKLVSLGVQCSIHLFAKGPHGVSLCDETVKNASEVNHLSMGSWKKLCLEFIKEMDYEGNNI